MPGVRHAPMNFAASTALSRSGLSLRYRTNPAKRQIRKPNAGGTTKKAATTKNPLGATTARLVVPPPSERDATSSKGATPISTAIVFSNRLATLAMAIDHSNLETAECPAILHSAHQRRD
jgi:hypothetical protein